MFGTQKESDLMIETFSFNEFPVELRMYIKTLLTACAYAGSGNVTKVQEMQHLIAKGKDEVHPKVQSIAVIAISMIALGEDIGSEMALRAFNHFLQYGDVNIKKSVSLATSLLKYNLFYKFFQNKIIEFYKIIVYLIRKLI